MKKITSLFLTLLLAIAITPSYADHHEKSVEQEIQAALKAGKITEKEAKEKLAYLERRKAETKKIAETQKKTNNTTSKKKTNQATAKKKFLFTFAYLGIVMTGGLWIVDTGFWQMAVLMYVLATLGFSGSNISFLIMREMTAGDTLDSFIRLFLSRGSFIFNTLRTFDCWGVIFFTKLLLDL